MKKRSRITLCFLIALCLLFVGLYFLPVPPGPWGVQEINAGYRGVFAKNDALDGVSFLSLNGYARPESVLCRDGYLYTGVTGGVLLRMREDGSDPTVLLETGGCLLGLAFDRDGDILAADCAYRGTGAILKVDAQSGAYTVFMSRDTGTELYYPNAIAVGTDGTVYVTDSSTAFRPAQYHGDSYAAAVNEALMHTATGRILARDPASGSVRVIAAGLDFANGIALSADERSLYVCETYLYCINRVDIATGTVESFLANLPGYPDNLTPGLDGRYWVGLANQRSDSLDRISNKPFLRKCVWLYGKLSPAAEPEGGYGCVFAFTENGAVTECLQSGTNGYYKTTAVTETAERLYIQAVNQNGTLAYLQR